ncbi:LSU ribosomal protein L18p (L5e) [Mucinivorans hirudinis]|uniref:Large ribosomal subunit protein uL18 n=1 Tax=Mucinivorans hirudinis TaxID=1433126 RepID=A0A060R788_9BACT|nr:LSU ribosomal protein L18p (L5e) [Mucinivorans hirudinis]
MALTKLARRERIKRRVRKVVNGTAAQPRLSVFRSNKSIYAQLIDDLSGATLCSASSIEKEIVEKVKGLNKTQVAAVVGKAIAEKALAKGITNVAFDRNGYLYHGRVKQLADSAREGGLKF